MNCQCLRFQPVASLAALAAKYSMRIGNVDGSTGCCNSVHAGIVQGRNSARSRGIFLLSGCCIPWNSLLLPEMAGRWETLVCYHLCLAVWLVSWRAESELTDIW